MRKYAITLMAVLAVSSAVTAGTITAPDFTIGVFYQPISLMDTWKGRGVNTLFGAELEGYRTVGDYSYAANQRGLFQIREPGILAVDAKNPYLTGFIQPDEPNQHNIGVPELVTNYQTWKAAAPGKLVYVNHSGGDILLGKIDPLVKASKSYSDVQGNDFYPVAGWGQPAWTDLSKPVTGPRWSVGTALDAQRKLTGVRPGFAFIETDNSMLPWVPNERGVTPGEFKGEIWDAVIHGAKGISYFSTLPYGQAGWPGSFDQTPTSVVAEMIKQDRKLAKLGHVIASAENPSDNFFKSNSPTLQATWRHDGKYDYFIVENLSSTTLTGARLKLGGEYYKGTASVWDEGRSETLSPHGWMTDSFAPFETHVYAVRDLTGGKVFAAPQLEARAIPNSIVLLPEPTSLTLLGLAGFVLMGRRVPKKR